MSAPTPTGAVPVPPHGGARRIDAHRRPAAAHARRREEADGGPAERHGERLAYGRDDAAASHSGRKSGRAAGDGEHRSVAAWRALSVQPAMRLGALPGWNVPGRCARSDAKPPVRRPLQMEQTMREWPLRGSSERQALSLRALHEDQGAYESGIAFCRPPQSEGARDGSATRAARSRCGQ